VSGYSGLAKPVFDVDSVALLALLRELGDAAAAKATADGAPDAERRTFFLGCAIDPFKRLERDLIPQYLKLALKARSGADYAITQVGYDARRGDQLLRWMRREGIDLPVVANAYILAAPVARAFNAGKVPGCVVTDDLLALVESAATGPDKGRAFFLEFAAKQLVVARGMGFRGIYLSGHRDASEIGRVLEMADAHDPADWRALVKDVSWGLPGSFQPFESDGNGLSTDELNRAYAASLTPAARRRARRGVDLGYKVNRTLHARAFEPGTPGFRTWTGIFEKVERRHLDKPFHLLEQAVKAPMFDCRDCGDCSLPDIAYLCPESHCQKNQRNGPCGGAHDGLCEVPGHTCIWSDAYRRMKPYGEELTMLDRAPVVQDNDLRRTSAWANTFLGRDHYGRAAAQAAAAQAAEAATSEGAPATPATPAPAANAPAATAPATPNPEKGSHS
jgi:methylenetetrahydrofolate reductase (NADPH)